MIEIILTKFLSRFTYPLGFCLLLVILSGILTRRKKIASMVLLFSSAGILWICSLPPLADYAMESLESRVPPKPVERSPSADAIVVLGGAVGISEPPRLHVDLRDTSDRVLHAARLYRAGKASVVIVSGGFIRSRSIRSEAVAMAQLLVEWGVPKNAIITESKSLNTYQNACNTKKVLDAQGLNSILLVTSAMHMPRALATFRTAGIHAIPSPTDYEVVKDRGFAILDVLPDAKALEETTRAFKEYLGFLVYRWRGWIKEI